MMSYITTDCRDPFGTRPRQQAGARILAGRLRTAASPGAERIQQVRREIAAGTYLTDDLEAKLAAVLDGLTADLLDDGRHTSPRRAAG